MPHSRLAATLAAALAPVALGLAIFTASPAPASAACSMVYNLYDRTATNAGSTNPGGTGINLAYNGGTSWTSTTVTQTTGYTNETRVSVDIWSLSPSQCAGLPKPYFYGILSRSHESIFDLTTSGANADDSLSNNWSSVDAIAATRLETSTYQEDWANDWTGYYNLDAPDTTVASGTSYTVYGDITTCDISQGTTNGFSGDWARRTSSATDPGGFYWLALGTSSTYSKYYDTAERSGGGGKGYCSNITNTGWSPYYHGFDRIIYDAVDPVIGTFAGPPTNGNATLTIGATDSSSPWLMAFSNSAVCDANSTATTMWSNWELYAASKSWAVNTTAYGGATGEGVKTVCIRVMDRAGNIALASTQVRYDTTGPACTPLVGAGATFTNTGTVAVTTSCSDPSGLAQMRFANDGATWSPFETYAATKSGWSVTTGYGGTAGDGTKTVTLWATDAAGNAATASDTIVLDRTAPVVTSFTTAVASPTNDTSIAYALIFSESATGLAAADLTNAGTATDCVFAVAGSGAGYTVTVTGCGTTGTLAPRLAANGVVDLAGNAGPAGVATGSTLTLDRVPPAVSTFTTAVASPTNATSLAYTLVFSESVAGLAVGDLSNGGTATGCSFTVAGSGTTYTVTVATCSASGTLAPRLAAGGVTDTAGNTGPAVASSGTTITLDRVPPAVSSFTTAVTSPTASTSIAYSLVLDEAVTGLAPGDLSNAGTASGCVFAVAGSGAGYTVTVTGCGTTGTLAPRLAANGVVDLPGNAGPSSGATGSTLTLDRVGPVISAITPGSGALTNLSAYPVGFSAVDAVSGMGATYVARASVAVSGSACGVGWSAYETEIAAGSGFVSVGLVHATCYRWRIRALDALGNESIAVSDALLVDQVAPVINAFFVGDGSGTAASPTVPASVTATDALSGVTGVRWSTEAGYDWASTPWLAYPGNRAPTLTLADGAGDYGVAVQVRDAAGNIATTSGLLALQTDTRMPQLVLGATIVDCAAPGTVLSVNGSGTVYWAVGRDLCLVPRPAVAVLGSRIVAGVVQTGTVAPGGLLSFTLRSANPCVAPCAGLLGRYPDAAVGVLRSYSAGSAATYLALRLDRETTSAVTSLTAVSLVVSVSMTITWSDGSTQPYTALLSLQVRSLATGQRPR